MPRITMLLAILLAIGSVGVLGPLGTATTTVAAQHESPEIGEAVPFVDDEGVARGSVSVTELADPFLDFDPAYPPPAGTRYVLATVGFDADAGERFDITPWSVVLQDTAGFLWNPEPVVLPEDSLVPELTSETLAPGNRISGVVAFALPEGAEPARVFYQPVTSRLITLAELVDGERPGPGDAVMIADSNGGMGTVAVAEIADPFEDYDPSLTPPEGARFVLLTLVYENTSDGRFDIEPYGLLLRDGDGNLWDSTSISRLAEQIIVPDLGSEQLAPGDRRSGVIGYAIPENVDLAGMYLSPESSRLLLLADLEHGGTRKPVEDGATPVPVAVTSQEDACAGVEAWLAAARNRIREAVAMSVQDAQLTDLGSLGEHMDAYVELAEEQFAEPAPAELEEVNAALGETLQAYSAAVEQILTAGEPGKDPMLELTKGMNAFNEAGQSLNNIEAELGLIATDCGLT